MKRFSISTSVIVVAIILAVLLIVIANRDVARNKILIIGVDGAEWNIINPMVERGELPHFGRLIKDGTSGNLTSLEPILSPLIWTSMATGKTPEKHGITWFMVEGKDGRRMPVTSRVREVKALWNILNEYKRKVGFIGWWATWPAETVNGFIISDHVAYHGFGVSGAGTSIGKTYPEELISEVEKQIRSPLEVRYDEIQPFINISRETFEASSKTEFDFSDPVSHFRHIYCTADGYSKLTSTLGKKSQPDLLAVYYEGVDSAGHLFMKYAPPKLDWVAEDKYEMYKDVVTEFYKYQDRIIGEHLKQVNENTTVFVVSDHGFRTGAERLKTDDEINVAKAHEDHKINGIIIMYGNHIRKGFKLTEASVLDVTPTILYLMGLPVAKDMDGVVLKEAIESEHLKEHPVRWINSYESENPTPVQEEEEITASDVEEKIIEQLKSLGYISSGGDDASSQIHLNRGVMYKKKGMYAEALKEFNRAIEMSPQNLKAHNNIGAIYKEQGNYVKAIEKFNYVLGMDPKRVLARANLAEIYLEQNRLDNAIAEYKRVLEIDLQYVDAYANLGNCYHLQGNDELAIQMLNKALKIYSMHATSHYTFGAI